MRQDYDPVNFNRERHCRDQNGTSQEGKLGVDGITCIERVLPRNRSVHRANSGMHLAVCTNGCASELSYWGLFTCGARCYYSALCTPYSGGRTGLLLRLPQVLVLFSRIAKVDSTRGVSGKTSRAVVSRVGPIAEDRRVELAVCKKP